MKAFLHLQRAGLSYEGHQVLHDIDFELHVGERVALIGPNGCGKSSMLRLIHGIKEPQAGQRLVDRTVRISMLFQRPHMLNTSTQRHVALGPWMAGASWRVAMEQAVKALNQVGLGSVADQSAQTLSGGQQQRAALARVWALQPDLLLLDEPTSNLDPRAKQDIEQLLTDWLAQKSAPTLVFASHNLGQVKRLATRVVYLESGRILADLPVNEFFNGPLQNTHPQAHLFVRGEIA